MRFTLLGSGAVRPDPEHWGPAQVVQAGGETMLFDCGRGASMRLVEAGLPLESVGPVFFTHHHCDHNCDFPYFFIISWVLGRQDPLEVYGPRGTEAFCHDLFAKTYADDIVTRARHPMYSKRGCEWAARDVTEERWILERPGCRITMVHGNHCYPTLDSLAFRIDADGKSVVIVGDTAVCDAVKDLAEGCDLLVHECTFPTERIISGHWQEFHTPPRELGQWAKKRGVKRLVLKHFAVQEGVSVEAMAAEVRENFGDEGLIVGKDLLTIDV